MSEAPWPPPVREARDPEERPLSPPEPAEPGTPEAVGAVTSEETKVVTDEELEEETPPRGRLLTGLLVGGLVVMTALAATFLTLWLGSSEIGADDVRTYLSEQRPEIEGRARIAVDVLINYDSTNLKERRDEMLAISTGSFRDDYDEFTESLGSVLAQAGASSTGSILSEPDISFASPEEAIALVRAEQITQTSDDPTGRSIEYVLQLGLIDTRQGWKVDSIEILSEEIA